MSLTSRQRFQKVFNKQMPDRVPVTLFIQDQGHFISQLHPKIDPLDTLELQKQIIQFQRELGADVFVRLLFGIYDPINWRLGGLEIFQQTENWEVSTNKVQNDETTLLCSTIHTPDGDLYQEFSIHEVRPGTFLYGCTKKPIHTMADLEIAIAYEPRMASGWPEHAQKYVQEVRRFLGDDGIIGVWTPNGPFNTSSRLIDESELYALFLTEPAFFKRLMSFSIDRVVDYTRALNATDIDVNIVGGNAAGGFLGKRNYDKHILPFEKQYIDIVQESGKPAIYHNCGQIMALIESYKELGTRVVEPFSPPPKLGDADLEKAKEVIDGDYVIIGGVDQVLVLQQGTKKQVEEATINTMQAGKPGGNFIIQNADFLEYGTPLENVETFVNTALNLAAY